ncbi:unnamed protein product [Durusdinium trenchii]|uniref:Uncharacterized protein n=1 Tax=Durusdinium trenchii TaxID=1381693 RepID=A0ABP0I5M7_9DINO
MRLPGFETILRTHLRVGVRHWASAAQTEGLQCGAQTNAGKLAGAIVARIREKSRVSIDTVGPQAGYTALKSIMIAEEYAKQDFKDKVLVVRPEMVKLEPREAPSGRMTETNALRMHVAAADQFKEVQQELVYFSGDTNPGTAAGLLSRLVESKGTAPVACMGAAATSKVYKAFLITEDYLRRNKSLGDKVIAFHARKDTFKADAEDRTRLLLSCWLVPTTLYESS